MFEILFWLAMPFILFISLIGWAIRTLKRAFTS